MRDFKDWLSDEVLRFRENSSESSRLAPNSYGAGYDRGYLDALLAVAKERFMAKVRIHDSGCWIWVGARNSLGYGRAWDGSKERKAHRLSYELHCGPIPDGKVICHKCDNPPCVNPDHLFPGTQAENTADMFAKGRGVIPKPVGANHGRAKLSDADVEEIRASTCKQRELAAQFGVTQACISLIKAGKIRGVAG